MSIYAMRILFSSFPQQDYIQQPNILNDYMQKQTPLHRLMLQLNETIKVGMRDFGVCCSII
jgi:hypothetical protein